MKNCQIYYGHKLLYFIEKLWTTDEFKKAHRDIHPELWDILDKATQYPICFYEPNDPLERSHFSTFYRYIPLRHYDNPAVNDLYYLHELAHLAGMHHLADSRQCETPEDYKRWASAMEQNEIQASLISEVFVYLWFPTLRQKTFTFEIWVDRFLAQGAEWTPEWVFVLNGERMRAMERPNNDQIEQYIHKYFLQNKIWADIWSQSFYKVNKNINLFESIYDMSSMIFDFSKANIFKDNACRMWTNFVEENTKYGIPFRKEASQFSEYLGTDVKTMFKV
jgi:hypothetical protein